MVFDTDVLIWLLRGDTRAAKAVNGAESRAASVVTYMELLQGARDNAEARTVKAILSHLGFRLLPLTENIGHRALVYMEEYALASSLGPTDALIAATAVEADEPLLTANDKHYKAVKDLQLKRFRP